MTISSRWACALLVSTLVACGGKSFDANPEPSGGIAQGGSEQGSGGGGGRTQGGSSAGSSKGGAGNAGMSPGGTDQAGSSGTDYCGGFEDQAGTVVQVAILNKTSTRIYLGQDMVTCGLSPLFQVSDAAGDPLAPPNSCNASCRTLQISGAAGCPAICAYPSAVALQPGETLYITWNGLYQLQRTLPSVCSSGGNTVSCSQTTQVQPGNFTFSAVAGRDLDCLATTGGPCSGCTPASGGTGGCTTPGSLITGERLNATTSVVLDYRYGVYGSAAPAPLPPGDSGSGSGHAIALQTVQLVFTE